MTLDSSLIPDYAVRALSLIERAGFEGWCVGGCVRDLLRGTLPHDWDITTSAMPHEVLEIFSHFHTIPTGIKHGTVTVIIYGTPVEITTYRCDGDYLDHRRPRSVKFVRDIKSDLERRDFTINAICLDLRGNVYDPFGGIEDIERGVIRCVGEPSKRFDEDALRILRAVRFAAKTGFPVEKKTLQAAFEMKGLLNDISVERVLSELRSLVVQQYAGRALIDHKEIIAQVIPEIRPCFGFPQNNPHHCFDVWEHIANSVDCAPPDEILRLVMLFHDIGKPEKHTVDERGVSHFKGHPKVSAEMADDILRRLKSDTYTRKRVCALIAEHDNRISADKKSVRRFISKYDYGFFCDYIKIRRADTLAQSEYRRSEKLAELDLLQKTGDRLKAEQSCIKVNQLAIGGRELLTLGLKGKEIGDMLKYLLNEVIEERLPNEREAQLEAAERRMNDNCTDTDA